MNLWGTTGRHETGIKKTSCKITRTYYKKIMGTSHLNDDLRLRTGPRTAIFVILATPVDFRGLCRKINHLSAPLALIVTKGTGESRWKKGRYIQTIARSRVAKSSRSRMKERSSVSFLFTSPFGVRGRGRGRRSDNEIVKNWADATRQL